MIKRIRILDGAHQSFPKFFNSLCNLVQNEAQFECEKDGAEWITGSNFDEAKSGIRAVGFGVRMNTSF